MTAIAERVAAGAAFLDEHDPGWWQRIDLERLDLGATCDCILGQLVTDSADHGWTTVLAKFGLRRIWNPATRPTDVELGFNASGDQWSGDYDALTAEWRKVITARREAAP